MKWYFSWLITSWEEMEQEEMDTIIEDAKEGGISGHIILFMTDRLIFGVSNDHKRHWCYVREDLLSHTPMEEIPF